MSVRVCVDFLKRQFPTLAQWPGEKWMALPAVVFLVVAYVTVETFELFLRLGY